MERSVHADNLYIIKWLTNWNGNKDGMIFFCFSRFISRSNWFNLGEEFDFSKVKHTLEDDV